MNSSGSRTTVTSPCARQSTRVVSRASRMTSSWHPLTYSHAFSRRLAARSYERLSFAARYGPKHHEQAARGLERVRIVAERQSDSELTISTTLPHKRFLHLLGGKGGVKVEYLTHAPRDSRLVIQHGAGYVLVRGLRLPLCRSCIKMRITPAFTGPAAASVKRTRTSRS